MHACSICSGAVYLRKAISSRRAGESADFCRLSLTPWPKPLLHGHESWGLSPNGSRDNCSGACATMLTETPRANSQQAKARCLHRLPGATEVLGGGLIGTSPRSESLKTR